MKKVTKKKVTKKKVTKKKTEIDEAAVIIFEIRKAIMNLLDAGFEESYIEYIIFQITGGHLLSFLGPKKFNELIKEIKDRAK